MSREGFGVVGGLRFSGIVRLAGNENVPPRLLIVAQSTKKPPAGRG
jgi:hypothetical protein